MNGASAGTLGPVAVFAAIARTLTESLELPEVLQRIASEMLALTAAQGVSIIMPRGELAEFVAHASPPPHSRIPVGFRFRPAPEMVAALASRREPLVILDLHASPLIPRAIQERITAQDVVVLPLRVDRALLGALCIAFDQLPERWPWDPALLRAVGDQAAVAVRNAQLYEEARRSGERLVQAERLSTMGRLVAHVAHELNNPLTTARLLTESLEDEPLSPPVLEQVHALREEVERAATVVRDLLLFSRKGRRAFGPVRIPEVVSDAVAEQARRMEAAGVRLATIVDETVPMVIGDARALRTALSNLLHNAVQALEAVTSDRWVEVRVRTETDPEQRRLVVIEVEDSGAGIPEPLRTRIFEPFFTTKGVGEGTGLGLAIVKEIVEAHGGVVEVDGGQVGGAILRLRLQAADAEVVATETVAHEPGSTPRRGLRVLVIDDEPELQRAMHRVLAHLGCEVTSALTGEEGYDRARTEAFDLILCDIRMPGMHGRDLYTRLSAEAPEAARVMAFMTGDTLTGQIRRFLESSGRPALAKPFGRAQLAELLRSMSMGRE
ncbi:MAG TPA: ATP-binding protein [Longimicrobiales bacterium]